MKIKIIATTLACLTVSTLIPTHAHADWFIRGSQNSWAADAMQDIGNNTVLANDVSFAQNGLIKFDRLADWSESYGIGGQNGGDIAVDAGTWDIVFYTDSKNWAILPKETYGGEPSGDYHFKGTSNGWADGSIMTAVAGESDQVEICQNFSGNINPRFKIDPGGSWGGDEFPLADVTVSPTWVRIVVDTASNSVLSVSENLDENCGGVADSDGDGVTDDIDQCPNTPAGAAVDANGCAIDVGTVFHLRGTNSGWAEGEVFTRVGSSDEYEICANFPGGDAGGGPRFKVDPNGGWGEDAFPATDVLVNPGFARVVINANTNSIVSLTDGLGLNCSEAAADFRSRTMYFLFVDRFQNGDTSNDGGNNPNGTSTVKQAGGVSEWRKYWGGDIQGIIDRLDYLEGLGVSAIWVTPLIDNTDNTTDNSKNPPVFEGAYHGYWGRDFFAVDEHLGDWDLVDELDREMEARGMKLVLDIALNHSNQDDAFEFGTLLRDGQFVTDFNSDNGTWYHKNGNITDCGDNDPTTNNCFDEWDNEWTLRNKSLFHLSDFNHGINSNSPADQYLIDAALKWMEHGVDAFRIDAIKHMEPSFVNRFSAAMRAENPEVYIFGEWFGAGINDGASMEFLAANRGSELLDFGLRDAIEQAIADDINMISLNGHIQARASAMGNREDWQPIFLDNHDDTRTSVYLQADGPVTKNTANGPRQGKNWNKGFADARQNLGMALVMTLPGIPTVYYGTEQNSTWFGFDPGNQRRGADPFNREPMPGFDQSTAAYQLISTLANLRKDSPALAKGSYTQKWVDDSTLAFERNEGGDTVLVVVNKGGAKTITISGSQLANDTYNNLVGSGQVSVSGGSAQISVGANGVVVIR